MNKLNKFTLAIIHILVWCVLFSFPYVLSSGNNAPMELKRAAQHTWSPLLLCAIVFYVNYLFLVEKFLLKRKFIIYFGTNILLFVLLIWVKHAFLMELSFMRPDDMPPNFRQMRPPRKVFIYMDSISLLIPLILSIALKMGESWVKAEADKKEAEKSKLQSELQHLKYQLQPHFFFNSLNNIYSLVDISPEKAKTTIHSLGKLMRYLLYESNSEKVDLIKEIEFLTKYIELMKLRSSENVKVESNFSNVQENVKVAPLMFISLIENAFKHGISATEPSQITFELKVEKGIINFHSGNQNFVKSTDDKSGSGIGLENLKKRLELIYPEKHIFNTEDDGSYYQTKLIIDTN